MRLLPAWMSATSPLMLLSGGDPAVDRTALSRVSRWVIPSNRRPEVRAKTALDIRPEVRPKCRALPGCSKWRNPRAAKAAADDNMFPAAFAKTNSRGVPVIGLCITAAIMSACLLLAVIGSVGQAFDRLVSSSVLMALVPYIFSATAVGYFVRGKVSDRAHWALVAVAVVAAAFCVWLITTADRTSILFVVVLSLVMGPLYRLYVQTSVRTAKAPSSEERT